MQTHSQPNYNIWKDIPGYEGCYQASRLGDIKSLSRSIQFGSKTRITKDRILKPATVNGYLQVSLQKNGVAKLYKVHRLVALTFLENNRVLPEINHIDENKKNNCVDNLEWCSRKYNANHGTAIKRQSEKSQNRADTSKPVLQMLNNEVVAKYPSCKEAQRKTGINHAHISRVCHNKKRNVTAGGYNWKFL